MICSYGMDEDFGLLATPELFQHAVAISSPTYERVNGAVRTTLKEEMQKTLSLLETHRPHLDAVSRALLEKNRLYRPDLEDILPRLSMEQAAS